LPACLEALNVSTLHLSCQRTLPCRGGEQALQTNFESEQPSSWYADLYKRDALTGGHVIMLGADDASKAAATAALAAYPGGLQLGGGVTVDNAKQYLDAGASHVIVTSYVFREGRLEQERLAALVELVGSQRLVLDLSCRKKEDGLYYVVTDRWQKFSDLALRCGCQAGWQGGGWGWRCRPAAFNDNKLQHATWFSACCIEEAADGEVAAFACFGALWLAAGGGVPLHLCSGLLTCLRLARQSLGACPNLCLPTSLMVLLPLLACLQ
jgi:hypothetical protein